MPQSSKVSLPRSPRAKTEKGCGYSLTAFGCPKILQVNSKSPTEQFGIFWMACQRLDLSRIGKENRPRRFWTMCRLLGWNSLKWRRKKKGKVSLTKNQRRVRLVPEEDQMSLLRRMQHTLDDIKSILVLSNQDKLAEAKKKLLKEGSIKQQIYELCDGIKNLQDIAIAIQKSTDYVSSYLTILRREGLIRTVEREGKQVHEQIF